MASGGQVPERGMDGTEHAFVGKKKRGERGGGQSVAEDLRSLAVGLWREHEFNL